MGRQNARFGILLPTREAVVSGRQDLAPLLAFAERAEELGFDAVWAGDSPIARPRVDPLILLAAVAARTSRVQIGTAVLIAALRSPVLLAHSVATLDQLCGGRLTVGVGAGFPMPTTEAEFMAAGVPFERRIGRLLETITICRGLWASDPQEAGAAFSFSGAHFELSDVRLDIKPQQPTGPAIWLAGGTPAALCRTGRVFDGWLPYSPTPSEFEAGLAVVRESAAAAGRDHDAVAPGLYVTVAVDDRPERAEVGLERYVRGYYGLPLSGMRQLQAFYGGSADGCADFLARYMEAGAQHLVLRIGTLENPEAMTKRVAEDVLPRLREGAT